MRLCSHVFHDVWTLCRGFLIAILSSAGLNLLKLVLATPISKAGRFQLYTQVRVPVRVRIQIQLRQTIGIDRTVLVISTALSEV
jgi:hypothetical protein